MTLIDGTGCWARTRHASKVRGGPALFLDRDGVIIEEVGYLARPEDMQLIDNVASAIARVNALGIPVVVATNQSGIARGLLSWSDFEAVQDGLELELARRSAHFDLVLACGYYAVGGGELNVCDHAWRKPNPGMLLAARDLLDLDLERSLMVGDRISDLEAAHRAGIRRGALVRTGYGKTEESKIAACASCFSVTVSNSLAEAIDEACSYLFCGIEH